MMNKKTLLGYFILILVIITDIVIPVCGITSCGPSKGLFSGATLILDISPTGTVAEKPNVVDEETKAVQVQVDPSDFVSIGNNLISSGQYEEAISAYDKALAVTADNSEAYNGKMSALLYLEKYDDVLTLFSDAQKKIPDNYGIWINKGRAEYYTHNIPEALKSAEKALELDKDNVDALILKADTLSLSDVLSYGTTKEEREEMNLDAGINSGIQAALDTTDYILSQYPDNKDVWYARGNAFYYNEDYDKALEEYEKDLTYYPDRICSHFYIIKILIDEGKTDEAMQALSNMTDSFPDNGNKAVGDVFNLLNYLIDKNPDLDLEDTLPYWEWVFSHAGSEYNRGSYVEDALNNYIKGDIGSIKSINTLVNPLLTNSSNLSEEEIESIVTLYARFARNINTKNRSLEAIEAADKIIELDPDNQFGFTSGAWYDKAFTLVNMGRNNEALSAIDNATRLNPDDYSNLYYKSDILKTLGRADEADEVYAAAQALEGKNNEENNVTTTVDIPEDEGSLSGMENLNTSDISGINYDELLKTAEQNENWEDVVNITSEIISNNTEDNFMYYHLGNALYHLGKNDEALKAFDNEISLSSYPGDKCIAYKDKAEFLFKIGKHEETANTFEKGSEYCLQDALYWNTQLPEENIDQFLELTPENVEMAGYQLLLAKKYEEAADTFRKSISGGFTSTGYFTDQWLGLSESLNKLGKSEEADEAYKKAVNNTISEAFAGLASNLESTNDNEDILEAYSYAIRYNPEDVNVYVQRGDYLEKIGRYDDAISSYEEAMDVETRNYKKYSELFNQENWDTTDLGVTLKEYLTYIQEKIDTANNNVSE